MDRPLDTCYCDTGWHLFAFGPLLGALEYGADSCPDYSNELEAKTRTAAYFLGDITTPTFLIEGEDGNGPYDIPPKVKGDAPITVMSIPDVDHFSVIRPGARLWSRQSKPTLGPRQTFGFQSRQSPIKSSSRHDDCWQSRLLLLRCFLSNVMRLRLRRRLHLGSC